MCCKLFHTLDNDDVFDLCAELDVILTSAQRSELFHKIRDRLDRFADEELSAFVEATILDLGKPTNKE